MLAVVVLGGLAAAGVVAAVIGGTARNEPRVDIAAATARATSGDADAQLELANYYSAASKGGKARPAEAFRWYLKAAEQGIPEAQEAAGRMLLYGIGVPANTTAAMEWYRKAAEQGRAEAQGRLAIFYHDGISLPQDFALALQWYRKAAAQGHAESMYRLGIMYAEGQGLEQDFAAAGEWFRTAAENGYGFGVPEQYQEAVAWAEDVEKYRDAAAEGVAEAQYRLATLYYGPKARARNIPQDREAAVALYHSAAAKGHALAMYALGLIYQGKISRESLPDTDYVQAHMWYNLAASRLPPGPERDLAVKDRDFVARYRLSPEQLAEAQRLAREWQPSL
jgi:TPR repeat protein